MPMAVGLIGGAVKTHPVARVAMKILSVKLSNEVAEILAAVGLGQTLAPCEHWPMRESNKGTSDCTPETSPLVLAQKMK